MRGSSTWRHGHLRVWVRLLFSGLSESLRRLTELALGLQTGQSVVMGTDRLTWFNDLPAHDAQRALAECCSAPGWAARMAAARPYGAARDAIRQSSMIVAQLTVPDMAAALAGHPRIGERQNSDGWSRREQA